jgi:hypothetical protein
MSDRKSAIPAWVRGVFRTVGTLNAVFALIGTSFVVDSIYRFSTSKYPAGAPDAPYFSVAFVLMLAIEAVFLAILTITAVRLMKARFSTVNSYSLWVLAVIVYDVLVMMLSMRPGPVGLSINSASAITADGIFLELCFQIPSVILLQLIKRSYSTQRNRLAELVPSPRA